MISEQDINYRCQPEVNKKDLFQNFLGGGLPALLGMVWISHANIRLLFIKLDWKAVYIGGDKLNPFALPHRVVARVRRIELRRAVKSMIRKYHNHKPQTTPWHREEEQLNHHETPGRQIKQSNQLSLPRQDDCNTTMDIK